MVYARMEYSAKISAVFQRFELPTVKQEQKEVITAALKQQDVFCVLPTGFGKSICFQCLPFLWDQISPLDGVQSIVLVVTPLTVIMKDQVAGLSEKGVAAAYISSNQQNPEVLEGVISGKYNIVYFTPEMLLQQMKWRKMLLGEVYSQQLRTLVIDEAHTVVKWGKTFRRVMARIGEVRSLIPPAVNVMALTATATTKLRIDVSLILGMRNEFVLSLSPSKSNIMYSVADFVSVEDTFLSLAERVKMERCQCPRVIIYCRSLQDCADIYLFFRNYLDKEFTEPPGAPNELPQFRLVDMYTSCTDEPVKEMVISSFTRPSCLRVVIATVAFGMGIDCPDVRQIIHLGIPDDLESYVQETGRAGRDNSPSLAVLLNKSRVKKSIIEKSMLEYASNDTRCRRDQLFENFDLYSRTFSGPLCLCCDVCLKYCDCMNCSLNNRSFIFF